MNKMQLPFALALLISCGAGAMEKNEDSLKNTPCKFHEYKFKGTSSVVCPLFDEDEIPTLVTEKCAQEEDEHLDLMVKQITKPETIKLFADVLKLYKESRQPYRPWCGAASTKRNIEIALEGLKYGIVMDHDMCENAACNRADCQLAEIINLKKKMRKRMAAQVALTLIELAELDKKALELEKLDAARIKNLENSEK